MVSTAVTRELTARNIPHRIFRHPGHVTSLEQAARERGQRPEQVVRSLLFRLSEGEYIMVLVAGPQQVDWRALRRRLDRSRLTMADRDEVLDVTGYEPGAVSPFGLPSPIPVLVDESLLDEEELSLGSGMRGTAVLIQREDLLRALGDVEIARVT